MKAPRQLPPTPPVSIERDVAAATWRLLNRPLAAGIQYLIPRVIALVEAGSPVAELARIQNRANQTAYFRRLAADVAPDTDDLATVLERAQEVSERSVNVAGVNELAERTADRSAHAADVELGRQIEAQIGVNPLARRKRKPIARKLAEQSREHAALIRSIPDRFFRTVARRVREAVKKDRPIAELEAELRDLLFSGEPVEIANRMAKTIARDQVTKLIAAHTQLRQVELGIEGYFWRTQEDERVRGNPHGIYPTAKPSHFARNNVFFLWAKPPEGGHPGHAPGCRCYPIPGISPELAAELRGDEPAERTAPAPRARIRLQAPKPTMASRAKKSAIKRETERQAIQATAARAKALSKLDPALRRTMSAQRRRNEAANRREVEKFQRLRAAMLAKKR